MYNGKDYFTDRKAVNDVRKAFLENMRQRKEVIALGVTSSQLSKWERDGKLTSLTVKNKKYYNLSSVKKLFL